jgi:hypothetical protein
MKQSKNVRFQSCNNIKNNNKSDNNKSDNNNLDDEVKDHPIFYISGWCQNIQKQIQQDPARKKIINPQTEQNITRFGQRYWNLLKDLHCCSIGKDLFQNEKREYNKLCKNNKFID